MGVIDPNQFPSSPDGRKSGSERLALIASDLIRLRFAAARAGSVDLAETIGEAIVLACREAGIGPSEDAAKTAEWLAALLDTAAKTHPSYRSGPVLGGSAIEVVLENALRAVTTEMRNGADSRNPRSDPDRPD